MVDDFHTDDSMRDIHYDDLKSESEEEGGRSASTNTIETLESGGLSIMNNSLGNQIKKFKEKKKIMTRKIKKFEELKKTAGSHRMTANLLSEANVHTTALEHYKNLRKKRQAKDSSKNFVIDDLNIDATRFLA
mmetsp:Transcript_39576/g.60505  ORF Transcript_39576/g.60505 Transcript_39576/m.60505 type:complete len:133 (+) Transcript_39576:8269-8667(+)